VTLRISPPGKSKRAVGVKLFPGTGLSLALELTPTEAAQFNVKMLQAAVGALFDCHPTLGQGPDDDKLLWRRIQGARVQDTEQTALDPRVASFF
jgi:hypothetical protein